MPNFAVNFERELEKSIPSGGAADIRQSTFLISLDFELMWGLRDLPNAASYMDRIIGAREAIPRILAAFRKYEVRATWATVGLLLFDSKRELINNLPTVRPSYIRPELDPYRDVSSIGDNERADPYHYGASLARSIIASEWMELASHTFSHYYCLEAGPTLETFRADLQAAVAANARLGQTSESIVFPRNQFTAQHLSACRDLGFRAFRGNERHPLYEASPFREISIIRRGKRLLDSYVNISGNHVFTPGQNDGLLNLQASRFLRPFDPKSRLLNPIKLNRIKRAMMEAATSNGCFHLWWHPHNFGASLEQNMSFLELILKHFAFLREKYGFMSRTMAEVARAPRNTA